VHRRTYFKKNFTKQELNTGIDICRQCHRAIHQSYTEMELAKQLNSLDKIKQNHLLNKHFAWIAKQRILS